MTGRLLFTLTNMYEVTDKFERCKIPKSSDGNSIKWMFHNPLNVAINIGLIPEKFI